MPRRAWRGCANGWGLRASTDSSCRAPTSIRGSTWPGAAGVALILADGAHLFVDGRYTLQAAGQVDPELFAVESLVDTPPPAWIAENLLEGTRLGFDPWLHTIGDAAALRKAVAKRKGTLVADLGRPAGTTAGAGGNPS